MIDYFRKLVSYVKDLNYNIHSYFICDKIRQIFEKLQLFITN